MVLPFVVYKTLLVDKKLHFVIKNVTINNFEAIVKR